MKTWPGFVAQTRHFAVRNRVSSEGSPFSGDLGDVEGLVHELCHWVSLGYALPRADPEIDLATITARLLRDLAPRVRNSNECLVIGAEICVLARVYPRWSGWHRARLLAYAQNSLDTDYVHRTEEGRTGITAYAKARLARADRTVRAQRVAAAVARALAQKALP